MAIDSNVFVSALLFGGKPSACLKLVYEQEIIGITSDPVISETLDVLAKKFKFAIGQLEETRKLIEKNFIKVYPSITLNVSRDPDDNRILEAALAGKCEFIITGDTDLMTLKKFKSILILTPSDFLKLLTDAA